MNDAEEKTELAKAAELVRADEERRCKAFAQGIADLAEQFKVDYGAVARIINGNILDCQISVTPRK